MSIILAVCVGYTLWWNVCSDRYRLYPEHFNFTGYFGHRVSGLGAAGYAGYTCLSE